MNRILDRLWIGNVRDLDSNAPLRWLGFVALLDLRDQDSQNQNQNGLIEKCIDNRDGDPWNKAQVEMAIGFIDEYIKKGRVLVVCAAGMSRSASMVIGYLVRSGWDLPSAYEHVKKARPEIAPMPKMLDSVLTVIGSF